jgi:hypothetical protein
MANAKDIIVKPITAKAANELVKRVHYSGKVVPNSQLHFGVFLNGMLEGVMQFGPSMDKRKVQGLVTGTGWNDFIELNRMAFSNRLPRNSESRAISVAMRLICKHYPNIQWVISFADGTQCGDGTIYRANGFLLTGIRQNSTIIQLSDGSIGANITYSKGAYILKSGGAKKPDGATKLPGFMLRYIYFLSLEARNRLTVPILPFSKIDELGAGMYKGKPKRTKEQAPEHPSGLGGASPTCTLHIQAEAQ